MESLLSWLPDKPEGKKSVRYSYLYKVSAGSETDSVIVSIHSFSVGLSSASSSAGSASSVSGSTASANYGAGATVGIENADGAYDSFKKLVHFESQAAEVRRRLESRHE